jgi:hypothetical protein
MVLLRKTSSPSRLKDYRPISLMHSIGKLVAKLLASRLAPHLAQLVQQNQSAFIRGRSIHDNFMAVQLACRWLYSSHCSAVLVKIDIAKAFDSVSWEFLLQLLTYMGFPLRWREWIAMLLSTASTRVIVNGRPGRKIWHARGLRQGDPLSPMLFVLVMEVVNAMISAADARGVLQPLPTPRIRSRASLYADDLVIFLSPVASDLRCIREILCLFADATGLVTNTEKCSISPIRCTDEDVATVLEAFPGRIVSFPCTYLGIPLTLLKPTCAEEQSLIDKIAARCPHNDVESWFAEPCRTCYTD